MIRKMLGWEQGHERDQQHQSWKRDDQVDEPHEHRVHPTTQIARHRSHGRPQGHADGHGDEPDGQRDPGPIQEPGQHVASQIVGAERMGRPPAGETDSVTRSPWAAGSKGARNGVRAAMRYRSTMATPPMTARRLRRNVRATVAHQPLPLHAHGPPIPHGPAPMTPPAPRAAWPAPTHSPGSPYGTDRIRSQRKTTVHQQSAQADNTATPTPHRPSPKHCAPGAIHRSPRATRPLFMANPWIDGHVEQVCHEVAHHHHDREDHARAHDHRIVPSRDGRPR